MRAGVDKPQEELGRREWGEGVAVVEELVLKFCKFRREERDRPNRTNGKTSRDNLIAWGLMVRDKRETWHKSTKEAELDTELKIGWEVRGISHFCRKLGNDVAVKIRGDSSAVEGILARRGSGKVKHLELNRKQ